MQGGFLQSRTLEEVWRAGRNRKSCLTRSGEQRLFLEFSAVGP